MEILVTGGAGFTGAFVCAELHKRGHVVHALGRKRVEGAVNIHADLSGPIDVSILPGKIDAVACLSQSRLYKQFPEGAEDMLAVNVSVPAALARYAVDAGASAFLLASTASVYGGSAGVIDESYQPNPKSFYAATRLSSELMLKPYAGYYSVQIPRFGAIYGPGQSDRLIPKLIDRVRRGEEIILKGEEGFTESFIYVDDVVNVIVDLLEKKMDTGVMNVAHERPASIHEIGQLIASYLGLPLRFAHESEDASANLVLDTTRLRELDVTAPGVDMERGLREVLA